MPLIEYPDCTKQISDRALSCIHYSNRWKS